MQLDLNIKQLVLHQEAGQDWGKHKKPKGLARQLSVEPKNFLQMSLRLLLPYLGSKRDCIHISFAIVGGHWPLDKEGVQKNEDNR